MKEHILSWQIYDDLLKAIPNDVLVEDAIQQKWWLIKTSKTLGIAMHFEQGEAERTLLQQLKGMKLRELANYIKSWNFYEATAAVAATNAYYNQKDKIEPLQPRFTEDAFKENRQAIVGKRVAVIGHFPNIEKLAEICELSILEKNPAKGDYPDNACEYILPQQDYVFITGTTLANKTLPRLLQLSKNAKVIMTGPSVPLTPILFDYGVDVLAGAAIWDSAKVWSAVQQGGCKNIFQQGVQMLQIDS